MSYLKVDKDSLSSIAKNLSSYIKDIETDLNDLKKYSTTYASDEDLKDIAKNISDIATNNISLFNVGTDKAYNAITDILKLIDDFEVQELSFEVNGEFSSLIDGSSENVQYDISYVAGTDVSELETSLNIDDDDDEILPSTDDNKKGEVTTELKDEKEEEYSSSTESTDDKVKTEVKTENEEVTTHSSTYDDGSTTTTLNTHESTEEDGKSEQSTVVLQTELEENDSTIADLGSSVNITSPIGNNEVDTTTTEVTGTNISSTTTSGTTELDTQTVSGPTTNPMFETETVVINGVQSSDTDVSTVESDTSTQTSTSQVDQDILQINGINTHTSYKKINEDVTGVVGALGVFGVVTTTDEENNLVPGENISILTKAIESKKEEIEEKITTAKITLQFNDIINYMIQSGNQIINLACTTYMDAINNSNMELANNVIDQIMEMADYYDDLFEQLITKYKKENVVDENDPYVIYLRKLQKMTKENYSKIIDKLRGYKKGDNQDKLLDEINDLSMIKQHEVFVECYLDAVDKGDTELANLYLREIDKIKQQYNKMIEDLINDYKNKYGVSEDDPYIKYLRLLQDKVNSEFDSIYDILREYKAGDDRTLVMKKVNEHLNNIKDSLSKLNKEKFNEDDKLNKKDSSLENIDTVINETSKTSSSNSKKKVIKNTTGIVGFASAILAVFVSYWWILLLLLAIVVGYGLYKMVSDDEDTRTYVVKPQKNKNKKK